jgi:hypothetical protein
MNFFRGDGTGMTVEGFSPNAAEDIQNDRNNTVRKEGVLYIHNNFQTTGL